MSHLRHVKLSWAAATALLTLTATDPSAALSLGDAVDSAFERHPERQLAAARRGLADALRAKSDAPLAADPAFTLRHETDAIGSGGGFRQWEGGVELPLWWPGQRDAYRREAELTTREADALARARRLEIAGEVRERLWRLELARTELAQAESALQLSRRLADDVKRRVDAGELPRSDELLANKEVLGREDARAQAANRVNEAQQLFTRYSGVEAEEPVETEAEPVAGKLPQEHPALRLTEAAVARARANLERVKSERRAGPTLWLGARFERAAAGVDYDSAVAMEISLPFGSSAHAAPAVAQAEADLTEALAARERQRMALEEALTSAELELARTRQGRELGRRRAQLAVASLELGRRAFELGETDLFRLLQTQESAISARFNAEVRDIEYARAVARMNQALGVLPQ